MTATAMTPAMTAIGFHGMPPTSVVGGVGGTFDVVGRGPGRRAPELAGGLPVGIELDALPGQDSALLGIGIALERILGPIPGPFR